jgi:death-on-curing protein
VFPGALRNRGGNKRVALPAAAVFLEINGASFQASEAEAVAVFRDLASGAIDEHEFTLWFDQNVSHV